MSIDARQEKWDAHWRQAALSAIAPAWVLERHQHLLPATGTALEMACGLADNALWLARKGFDAHAQDSSRGALERVAERMLQAGVTLQLQQALIGRDAPMPGHFDVIVVTRFLDRGAFASMQQALKPGGLLFYQTFVQGGVGGPQNPAYRLQVGELLGAFPGAIVRAFEEPGEGDNIPVAIRGESCIVVQKPE